MPTNRDLYEKLARLGLTKNEARVYLTALETGPTSVKDIASISRVKRSTVYDAIELLKKKRLISKIKDGKKTLIQASGPIVLEFLLEEQNDIFHSILPNLKALQSTSISRPFVTFQNSLDEIKKTYKALLKEDTSETLGFYSDYTTSYLGDDFIEEYVELRKKKKIPARTIAFNDKDYAEWKKKDEQSNRSSKNINTDTELPINIEITDDAVFITKLEAYPAGVLIQDKRVAEGLKAIFNQIWNKT